MSSLNRALLGGLACMLSAAAFAQTTVSDAWVRATVPSQKATGLFAQITSKTEAQLISASSPVAGVVEIHEMAMEGNVMKMRALPKGLTLPAGKAVPLAPGGHHIMLMDLKQALKAGDKVPVSLVVRAQGKNEVLNLEAEVRALGAPAKAEAASDHGAHGAHGAGHKH